MMLIYSAWVTREEQNMNDSIEIIIKNEFCEQIDMHHFRFQQKRKMKKKRYREEINKNKIELCGSFQLLQYFSC